MALEEAVSRHNISFLLNSGYGLKTDDIWQLWMYILLIHLEVMSF